MFPFRLVADLRPSAPYSVYSAPVYRNQDCPIEHRFAVRWDEDNDERVLAVVQALYYRAPREFRFCHAFAESKGTFTTWHMDFQEDVEKAILDALRGLPALLGDSWSVELINNFLPGLDLPPQIRAAAYLSVARETRAVNSALDQLVEPDSEAASALIHILGYKKEFQPGMDEDMNALHRLFVLGSFGKVDRVWV